MLRLLLAAANWYMLCSHLDAVCLPRPSAGTCIDVSWRKDGEDVYSNKRYPAFQSPQ